MADPYAEFQKPALATGSDPYAEFQTLVAQPVQQTAAEPQSPGFFKTLFSDLAGMLKPTAQNPYPGMGVEEKTRATEESAQRFKERKAAGYSLPYRVTAPVAESIGVNVSGMEESAKQGDPGGVLGHAAALPVAVATGEAVGRGLSKVGKLRTEMGGGPQGFARKFTGVESELKKAVGKAAEKTAAAEETHAEATETAKERQGLAKRVDEGSVKLGQQIEKVEASVAKEANAKFDAVREKIGNPETDPAPLIEAVRGAEDNILQGIPENIKEFRSILGHGEEVSPGMREAFKEVTGKEALGAQPMTWDKLQSLKSRLDAKLRQAGRSRMNGDVKRALYSVQSSIVDTMGQMAEANGAADLWADAKNTWRQYKEDFHEPTGPSGSGSPVAAALNAVDPKNIRQPFVAKQSAIGNRGLDILRKYPQHGGTEAAATAEEMLGHHENLRKMGSDKAIKPVKTQTVDATKVAHEAIARRASRWGDFNARDIGILASGGLGELIGGLFGGSLPERVLGAATGVGAYEGGKFLASRAQNKPGVIEWLSKTPPEELVALNKIPGADKVRIINALTDQAVGSKVRLSPAAKQLLGPANVARILGASAGTSTVHNRKDARALMGR